MLLFMSVAVSSACTPPRPLHQLELGYGYTAMRTAIGAVGVPQQQDHHVGGVRYPPYGCPAGLFCPRGRSGCVTLIYYGSHVEFGTHTRPRDIEHDAFGYSPRRLAQMLLDTSEVDP